MLSQMNLQLLSMKSSVVVQKLFSWILFNFLNMPCWYKMQVPSSCKLGPASDKDCGKLFTYWRKWSSPKIRVHTPYLNVSITEETFSIQTKRNETFSIQTKRNETFSIQTKRNETFSIQTKIFSLRFKSFKLSH